MCTQIFSEGTPFYPFYPLEKSLPHGIQGLALHITKTINACHDNILKFYLLMSDEAVF